MPSNMKSEYASVPKGGDIARSSFDLTETHKTTFDGDFLVPIYWNWAFPGDVWKGSVDAFLRMSSPLDTPIMDNMKLTVHWYACPVRILWDNFRKFYGEQETVGASIDYTLPKLGSNSAVDTSIAAQHLLLMRYLGIPVQTAAQGGVDEDDISALPFRAYNQIFNWHYRDQQQQDNVYVETGDGPDDGAGVTGYVVRKRGKRHDYFTSALPAPIKGDAVPVSMDVRSPTSNFVGVFEETSSSYRRLDFDSTHVNVSSTGATAPDMIMHSELLISELRNAAAIQQFLERDNRYGTRFDEQIYSHFGVEFNDVRIAPLFLGGGSGYIQTSTIPNQSGSSGNLGDLAAIATGVLSGAGFTYAVDEPCIIMALANVTADLNYFQGIPRKFGYETRYDLLWPEFAGIGDQAILTKELYYQNDANDETVFGYVPRYEEMRTGVNRISGHFDSNDLSPLDTWHLAIDFGSQPVLGDTWISGSTPYARVQQVAAVHDFLADFRMNLRVARALPTNGVPGLRRL